MSNKKGRLTNMRRIACPTCHVKAQDYCVSVGLRGKTGGNTMRTSCHTARIVAAGLQRATKRTAFDRHKAGLRAWKTRLANRLAKEREIDHQFRDFVPSQSAETISRAKVLDTALTILEAGALDVTLNIDGVGEVHGTSTPEHFTLVVKR